MTPKDEITSIEAAPEKPLAPIASPDELVKAFQVLQEIKRKLLSEEDFYLDERGQKKLKISGWRKFGIAFGLSSEVLREIREQENLNPTHFRYKIAVVMRARGGREVTGVGIFSSKEVKFKVLDDGALVHPTKTDKTGAPIPVPLEHIVYSRAHTRAVKRAVQDMLGPIEQEEEENEESESVKETAQAYPQHHQADIHAGTKSPIAADQHKFEWAFIEKVLGEDLAKLVNLEIRDEGLFVKLDRKFMKDYGNTFLHRMFNWKYGVTETAAGLTACIKAVEGTHT